MIAALLLLATSVPPVQLHRTETERAGSPPFDLVPDELREAEIAACRLRRPSRWVAAFQILEGDLSMERAAGFPLRARAGEQ